MYTFKSLQKVGFAFCSMILLVNSSQVLAQESQSSTSSSTIVLAAADRYFYCDSWHAVLGEPCPYGYFYGGRWYGGVGHWQGRHGGERWNIGHEGWRHDYHHGDRHHEGEFRHGGERHHGGGHHGGHHR